MTLIDIVKQYGTALILFATSIISIGFSSWQYESNDNGIPWTPSWDTVCNTSPGALLRRKGDMNSFPYSYLSSLPISLSLYSQPSL